MNPDPTPEATTPTRGAFLVYVTLPTHMSTLAENVKFARDGIEWAIGQRFADSGPYVKEAPANLQPEPVLRITAEMEREPITIENRATACDLIAQLRAISTSRSVTNADVNDLIGLSNTYIDHTWGWTDLSDLDYKVVVGGYLLVFPTPKKFFSFAKHDKGTN